MLMTACHQKSPSSQPVAGSPDSVKKNFFPVADYLRSEIRYVDSTPLAIWKFIIRDHRTDSTFIEAPAFNRLAEDFVSADLGKDRLEKDYSEKSFMDETAGNMTFTYSTSNRELPLQRADVLVTPGLSKDKVKSIYLEKVFSRGDTVVVKKMYWKAKRSFLIVTILQPPGKDKEPIVDQLKVVWDGDPGE